MPDNIPGELNPPPRVLLGPGPSAVSARVLSAMTKPIMGYLDPEFISLMDSVADMLRQVFGAREGFTLPVSGTGSAGMEAGLANLLEPGDLAVVAAHGFFGDRLTEIAERQGATVVQVTTDWGSVVDPQAVEEELNKHPRVKLLAVVHAETSTGVLQPLRELSDLAHGHDALFLVDAVTSLGGNPVDVEEMDIDYCYSATQKCLGAPPGLSPVILSAEASRVIEERTELPRSWYLDLGLLQRYWAGGTRVYHHTAPTTMIYALREALRMVLEEGLENRYARHQRNGRAFRSGLEALGLQMPSAGGALHLPARLCARARRRRRRRPPRTPSQGLQRGDRRRSRSASREDLASRPHGRVQHGGQRAAPARGTGGAPAHAGLRGPRRSGRRRSQPRPGRSRLTHRAHGASTATPFARGVTFTQPPFPLSETYA